MALPDIEAQFSHIGIACQEATGSLVNAGVDATSRAAYWVSLLDAPPEYKHIRPDDLPAGEPAALAGRVARPVSPGRSPGEAAL